MLVRTGTECVDGATPTVEIQSQRMSIPASVKRIWCWSRQMYVYTPCHPAASCFSHSFLDPSAIDSVRSPKGPSLAHTYAARVFEPCFTVTVSLMKYLLVNFRWPKSSHYDNIRGREGSKSYLHSCYWYFWIWSLQDVSEWNILRSFSLLSFQVSKCQQAATVALMTPPSSASSARTSYSSFHAANTLYAWARLTAIPRI